MKRVKKTKYIIIITVLVTYYRTVLLYDINTSDKITWGIVIKKKTSHPWTVIISNLNIMNITCWCTVKPSRYTCTCIKWHIKISWTAYYGDKTITLKHSHTVEVVINDIKNYCLTPMRLIMIMKFVNTHWHFGISWNNTTVSWCHSWRVRISRQPLLTRWRVGI